jgi:hypothetical protein
MLITLAKFIHIRLLEYFDNNIDSRKLIYFAFLLFNSVTINNLWSVIRLMLKQYLLYRRKVWLSQVLNLEIHVPVCFRMEASCWTCCLISYLLILLFSVIVICVDYHNCFSAWVRDEYWTDSDYGCGGCGRIIQQKVFTRIPGITVLISDENFIEIKLTAQWLWGLNSTYCPGQKVLKFVIPLNLFTVIQYTKASSAWGIKGLYSALMAALKGS